GRTFMPEFPGNDKELHALAAYIKYLQETGDVSEGAQQEGVPVNPNQRIDIVIKRLDEEKENKKDTASQNILTAQH
ncbi:MAG TPA: cytochrome c, partial [Arachidicoccus sp.]